MRDIDHADKIMKTALHYELPDLESKEQNIGALDIFFGASVITRAHDVHRIFPNAGAPQRDLSQGASLPVMLSSQTSPPPVVSPQATETPPLSDQFPFAARFLQELVDKRLFLPLDPSVFHITKPETHHGRWVAPDFHQATPPSAKAHYEDNIAIFLQMLLDVLDGALRRAKFPDSGLMFKGSANDAIPGSSRKPDILLVKRDTNGLSFSSTQGLIEVKYTWSAHHRKEAVLAFADKSWFMFDQCDQRVHTIGGALCGSNFTGCFIDRGGFLSTFDINIETKPVIFLQCFLAMVIGSPRAVGFDQEWSASEALINMVPSQQDDDNDNDSYNNVDFAQHVEANFRRMRELSLYSFTVLARIFSHRALTGRGTKILIATRESSSYSNFSDSDETTYTSTVALATAANLPSTTATPSFTTHPEATQSPTKVFPLQSPPPASTIDFISPHDPFYLRYYLHPCGQVAIKDCWPTPDAIPEGYILEYLGGEELEKNQEFNRIWGIPTKIIDRFVLGEDPMTGKSVIDSTRLRRRNLESPIPQYEHRVHYRLATEEVCVDLSWFSYWLEFFMGIWRALKAHQFAVNERSILHRDISPPNIWLYVRTLEGPMAVPDWQGDKPPPKRLALWGDLGMAAPFPDFIGLRIGLFVFRCRVQMNGRNTMYVFMIKYADGIMQGTVPFMATELLWDQWGNIAHIPRHDLESFFWSILWSTSNFSGPYHQLRRWPVYEEGGPTTTPRGIVEEPPAWLMPGNGSSMSYVEIVRSRISFAGAFNHIRQFIDPYWKVDPVVDGLREMFNLFLPANIANRDTLKTELKFDSLPAVNHEKMIDIVERILDGFWRSRRSLHPRTQFWLGEQHGVVP